MNGHVEDSIFKNKKVLLPYFIPEILPNRMKDIETIFKLVTESLKGHVTHILITGQPGTGKTASVKFIFRKLRQENDGLFCYVNCFNKSTKMAVLYSIILEYFKEKRPTRKMPSRRGIAYDELLDSLKSELEKSTTRLVVCLDEVDQLEETELIYDLTRSILEGIRIQIIGISNNQFIFKNLDPRTKSSLYPLREIPFSTYTTDEMKEIINSRAEEAFQENVIDKEAVDYLAKFTTDKKGDVRIARETLIRAGELAGKTGNEKVHVYHVKEILDKSRHARAIDVIKSLTKRERFILMLIPAKGTHYQQLYRLYKSTDGHLGDRMLRNYLQKFHNLKLVTMERKGVGGSYFITLNTPKDVLFEGS